jgi:hypothetical protein
MRILPKCFPKIGLSVLISCQKTMYVCSTYIVQYETSSIYSNIEKNDLLLHNIVCSQRCFFKNYRAKDSFIGTFFGIDDSKELFL